MVPYADFNLPKFPDPDQALEKVRDLTFLSDIFPTGFHGCVIAGVGPVGLAAAVSAQLLGAACVIVGDMIQERLDQARSFGCEVIDLRQDGELPDKIKQILGVTEVDAFVDCVGFEARACGCQHHQEQPATVPNSAMQLTRAGGQIGIPGLYVIYDPGAAEEAVRRGSLSMRFGLGWAKSLDRRSGACLHQGWKGL